MVAAKKFYSEYPSFTVIPTVSLRERMAFSLRRLAAAHPSLVMAAMLVGMPAALLLGVTLVVSTVMLPVSLLMGWPL